MSHSTDEESTHSSGTDEPENYESNDADSLNFDEEEENSCPIPLACNLTNSIVGGSIVLRIDQTSRFMTEPLSSSPNRIPFTISIRSGPLMASPSAAVSPLSSGAVGQGDSGTVEGIPPGFLRADQSASRTTSLSDTASDNMSTRAVMGDASSTNGNNGGTNTGDDDADNSSQASFADSEADRVRRIHSSIFSSLENDLAELVRIREETIQFLETGTRNARSTNPTNSGNENVTTSGTNTNEASNNNQENLQEGTTGPAQSPNNLGTRGDPFILRERLTFHARPFASFHETFAPRLNTTLGAHAIATDANTITMNGRSYTPIAKFDDVSPGTPAKPYLDTGLKSCDEKAAAARKVLDKLLYGDPEDESASFVRRFWRESATQDAPSPVIHTPSPISLDIAAMAERTASLEATLEEAFDSIRLRLQQAAAAAESSSSAVPPANTQNNQREANGHRPENSNNAENNGENNNVHENVTGTGRLVNPNGVPYYQSWDEETSIMNNPLNYDIWNELEDGNDVGPTITVRINLAERRASARNRIRTTNDRSFNGQNSSSRTMGVGVGTNPQEGAEVDDDSTDDEEISNYFRLRANSILNGHRHNEQRQTSPSSQPQSRNMDSVPGLSAESRELFREIGIPEDLGRDLFSMFTFSPDEINIPISSIRSSESGHAENETSGGQDQEETPQPLFPRIECFSAPQNRHYSTPLEESESNDNEQDPQNSSMNTTTSSSNTTGIEENVEGDLVPQIPLMNAESGFDLTFDREDDCSARIYLDENNLNFPYESLEDNEQDDGE